MLATFTWGSHSAAASFAPEKYKTRLRLFSLVQDLATTVTEAEATVNHDLWSYRGNNGNGKFYKLRIRNSWIRKRGKRNKNKAIETEMGTKTSSENKKHLTSVY